MARLYGPTTVSPIRAGRDPAGGANRRLVGPALAMAPGPLGRAGRAGRPVRPRRAGRPPTPGEGSPLSSALTVKADPTVCRNTSMLEVEWSLMLRLLEKAVGRS